MNKKLEEKLAMLAFGDMSPEDMTRLEKEVAGDREAMLVLEDYRGMRSDLKMMGEVPEHQLSTERLRHAILTQGLKPKSRPQLGWLWMPSAAAALAFGFVFMRNSQQPVIPVANNNTNIDSVVINPPKDELGITDQRDAFAFASASGEIISVAQTEPSPKPVTAFRSRSTKRDRVDGSRVADLKARVMSEFDSLLVESTPSVRTADNPRSSAARTREESPIILIDSSARDSSTGAQKATEVHNASDVVVGG